VIPLGGTGAERSHKSFHDGVVHFSELLILEKPPEMSKKKRKKKESDDAPTAAGTPPGETPHEQALVSLKLKKSS